MSDSLPADIVTQILIRLPIKSIIISTSVCKTWKSIIQNPTFISTHLHHSTTTNNHNLLLFRLCTRNRKAHIFDIEDPFAPYSDGEVKELYSLHNDDDDFAEHARFDYFHFQADNYNGASRVVGTCNGLVCLSDNLNTYIDKLFLWNPCVRKFVKIPSPNVEVTFWTHGEFNASIGFGFDAKTNDYKVEDDDFKLHHFVLVFDLGDEVFREILLPEFPDYNPEGEEYGVASSWTIVLAIHNQDIGSGELVPRPIGFRRNGKVVLAFKNGKLVSWDLEGKEGKILRITSCMSPFVDSYVESLVLLDKATNGAVTY
uniref:F-box domain-containing protein n=1 Tax=Fagus sylvatica TaxID=28930 RepID=A0A2N9ICZ0_FAGSY